jgi:pyrimidine operon attenuation protein/uracil phosphoribosyltransferase
MRVLADHGRVEKLIDALARAVTADVTRTDTENAIADWSLVGIRSRGDVLAARLVDRLDPRRFGGRVGTLDITLYRDDLSEIGASPVVRTTEIPFSIDGLHVVLVDDVLMTGRSIRAALQSLMDLGRPRRVWLAVLVDRGGRELPIAPDHVALDCTDGSACRIERGDLVEVRLTPTDPEDAVIVRPQGQPAAVQKGTVQT